MKSLRDRLTHQLTQTRAELIETVSPIQVEDLGYAPAPDGKSYRALLVEIGAMEAESVKFVTTGVVPDWKACEAEVTGDTTEEILASLDRIQQGMLDYLSTATDESLKQHLPIPPEWQSFFDDTEVDAEEMVRWIIRHEYYHLGQLITYRWIQGHNPYRKSA